jgi:drug/metabolite transporter (DMT)-like permease
MISDPGRRVLAQYLALALVWGASFLFIKVGLEGLSPAQVVLGRLAAGASALVVVALLTRRPLPRGLVVWGHLAVVALLLCVVPFLLFAWAETRISSGLASIYNATTPLMTMLVALAALPSERPTRTRLAGLLVGFAGVVLVLGPWGFDGRGSSGGAIAGQLACLGATACYGTATVYLRRFVSPRGLPAGTVATVQVGLGALVMLAAAPFVAASPVHLTPGVVVSVLALGTLGTGLAYVWLTNIVVGWGATNASTVTYLTPLVGVVLGVVLLRETVTWNQPAGALVVVLGIAISQDLLGRRASGRPPADVDQRRVLRAHAVTAGHPAHPASDPRQEVPADPADVGHEVGRAARRRARRQRLAPPAGLAADQRGLVDAEGLEHGGRDAGMTLRGEVQPVLVPEPPVVQRGDGTDVHEQRPAPVRRGADAVVEELEAGREPRGGAARPAGALEDREEQHLGPGRP